MKRAAIPCLLLAAAFVTRAHGQAADFFTNFVRQVQFPSNVVYDLPVAPTSGVDGELSPLSIEPGGARFELWTIQNDPLTYYLLDTRYVGTYIPVADVIIRTEDPYIYTGIPRTRADRPFVVDVTTDGLLSDPDAPEAAKSVTLLRHVQSYGSDGNGVGLDRSQATLIHQVSLVNNATHRLSYTVSSIPGADRSKIRGEERFSAFSVADYQAPASQLASMYVQIWPVADGLISGITQNQYIRYKMPQITISLNDLYPDSRTYAQVYKGDPVLGTTGTVVPGSALIVYEAEPQDRVLTVKDWDEALNEDGRWTMELLTVTPFGTDRLYHVTFEVDRTIDVNASFTTIE